MNIFDMYFIGTYPPQITTTGTPGTTATGTGAASGASASASSTSTSHNGAMTNTGSALVLGAALGAMGLVL